MNKEMFESEKSETEYLDVVNEHNVVCDVQLRSHCHENKLIHRDVHVIFENSKKEIFLKKRVSTRSYPDMWESSVAGHVAQGESYYDAAVRETSEELFNVNCDNISFIGVVKNFNDFEKQFTGVFQGFADEINNVNPCEAYDFGFFSVEEALKMHLTPNTIMSLKFYLLFRA